MYSGELLDYLGTVLIKCKATVRIRELFWAVEMKIFFLLYLFTTDIQVYGLLSLYRSVIPRVP